MQPSDDPHHRPSIRPAVWLVGLLLLALLQLGPPAPLSGGPERVAAQAQSLAVLAPFRLTSVKATKAEPKARPLDVVLPGRGHGPQPIPTAGSRMLGAAPLRPVRQRAATGRWARAPPATFPCTLI